MSITTTDSSFLCFLAPGRIVPYLVMFTKMDTTVKSITPCRLKKDVVPLVSMDNPVRIMPFPIQTSVNDIPMIYPRVNRIQEIK
jgi:hypothetical protein